ncbi:hypothetical protein OQA88_217 [Cercophora sp. LCS_1]
MGEQLDQYGGDASSTSHTYINSDGSIYSSMVGGELRDGIFWAYFEYIRSGGYAYVCKTSRTNVTRFNVALGAFVNVVTGQLDHEVYPILTLTDEEKESVFLAMGKHFMSGARPQ